MPKEKDLKSPVKKSEKKSKSEKKPKTTIQLKPTVESFLAGHEETHNNILAILKILIFYDSNRSPSSRCIRRLNEINPGWRSLLSTRFRKCAAIAASCRTDATPLVIDRIDFYEKIFNLLVLVELAPDSPNDYAFLEAIKEIEL